MIDLNFRHLLYFATVARTGSVTAAARELHVTQPTVSEQIKRLEESLGEALLRREGRGLVLTEAGRTAYGYAEQIFGLGRDLVEAVTHHRDSAPRQITVGVSDVLPKLIAFRLLEPTLLVHPPVRLLCQQDRPERLISQLGLGELDLVLADAPMRSGAPVAAYSQVLGESGMSVFCDPEHYAAFATDFPNSLDGAPVLLPSTGTILRASIERWFDEQNLLPHVVAEFDDSAQLKAFGQAGAGAFFGPTAIENEISKDYYVDVVGRVPSVRERIYAIFTERSARHPATQAVLASGPEVFRLAAVA